MDDKVIVAIVSTSGVVLVALIGLFSHKRKPPTREESPIEPRRVDLPRRIPHSASGTMENHLPASNSVEREIMPKLVPRRMTNLSHQQIVDAIFAVPPFQRDNIEASFLGVYVTWRGDLNSASRVGDTALVWLRGITKSGLVHCSAAIPDCDVLLITPEGTAITVTGKIKRISEYDAALEDCKFEIS